MDLSRNRQKNSNFFWCHTIKCSLKKLIPKQYLALEHSLYKFGKCFELGFVSHSYHTLLISEKSVGGVADILVYHVVTSSVDV